MNSEVRYWLATVDCHAADSPMVRVKILVQAADSEQARLQGCALAQDKAPLGPKWVAFEMREVSSVQLPWVVSRVQWAEPHLSRRERREMERGLKKENRA